MENARRGWEKLSAAHRDVLDGLEYRISVIDLGSGRGTYYRLKAGPFDDIKAARQVCKAMKARKTFCVITDFSGDLLSAPAPDARRTRPAACMAHRSHPTLEPGTWAEASPFHLRIDHVCSPT